MKNGKKPITSFQDLDVYQGTYKGMLTVFEHILPKLPKEENFDLISFTSPNRTVRP